MDEKVLIKSEKYDVKKVFKVMVIIGAILSTIMLLVCVSQNMKSYDYYYETYSEHQADGYCSYYGRSDTCWRCEEMKPLFPEIIQPLLMGLDAVQLPV